MNKQEEDVIMKVIYTYVVSQLARGIPKGGLPYMATLSLDGFHNWQKWMSDNNVCLVVSRDDEQFCIKIEQVNVEKLKEVLEKEDE